MGKRSAAINGLLILIGCASSRVSPSIKSHYVGTPVKSIAISPGSGVLGDAIGVELFNRGYRVPDPEEAGRLIGRADLSEFELSNGANLETLKRKGVDALLVVKTAAGVDGRPQSPSVKLTSTRTEQIVAAVSWENGWGGRSGSIADRTMRKDVTSAAREIVDGLIKSLR